MNLIQFEQLLYEEESSTLDFKRDQYRFDGGTDIDRSELLKDILGFANGWRRSDAYILIGVSEVRGGKSLVVGTNDHLDDHTLQQFINSKLNRPIHFSYEVFSVDGLKVGIIRIELQSRPFYLKKDFGKLKKNEVYVRRGSSTDPTAPASPEEIARMGTDSGPKTITPEVNIEFLKPKRDEKLGTVFSLDAERCHMPDSSEIPDNIEKRSTNAFGIDMALIASLQGTMQNRDYFREVANYEFASRWLRPIRLNVNNSGKAAANDVRVEISFLRTSGLFVMDESDFPERPVQTYSHFEKTSQILKKIRPSHMLHTPGRTIIEIDEARQKLVIECMNIQPGREIQTEMFYLGVAQSGEAQVEAIIYAENLAEPRRCQLTINAKITDVNVHIDDLVEIANSRY